MPKVTIKTQSKKKVTFGSLEPGDYFTLTSESGTIQGGLERPYVFQKLRNSDKDAKGPLVIWVMDKYSCHFNDDDEVELLDVEVVVLGLKQGVK